MTKELEEYKKGRAAGMAAARKKAKEGGTPRRRKKVYRIKKPTVVAKQAVGKFQHKHPVLATVGTTLVALPIADRVLYSTTGQSLGQATGKNFHRLPGFTPIREITGLLFQRLGRMFR